MDVAQRQVLGQWFTPPEVADLALSLALSPAVAAQRPGARVRVLDPACGNGVFLARARARGLGQLCGIELDQATARAARAQVPGARIVDGDLFEVDLEPFDVVVGNPPYVRQERLTPEHKQRIRQRLLRDWPEVPASDMARLVGRGDLAAACILRALQLVRPGGRVALVVSSALLDAGYAAVLWQVLARCARVVALVEAPRERWFDDAAVNAMLLVIERLERTDAAPGSAEPVQIARLSVSTAEAAQRVRDLGSLAQVAEVRRAPADQPERWAAYLRAASAWFAFEAQAGAALVPLSALAEVRRGVTSGANDVFYMPRQRAQALGLEPALLLPLLRSPRDLATIAVDPATASHVALVCPAEPEALQQYPAAQRYIDSQHHVAERPTLRARRAWWALSVRPARLFLTKAYAARFVQHLAGAPMVADQRVYAVHPAPGIDPLLLAAVLNATFTALALESLGRSSMGEGALEWTVADAAHLPVLDPRRLDSGQARAACAALQACARRSMGTVWDERPAADRQRLDRAIAAAAPGIEGLLDEIWQALIDSVRRRNERPRGFAYQSPYQAGLP